MSGFLELAVQIDAQGGHELPDLASLGPLQKQQTCLTAEPVLRCLNYNLCFTKGGKKILVFFFLQEKAYKLLDA